MPKRLFSGDRAWKSDRIAKLPEEFRAEYSWIYSLALADGTFECDPKKIWAECYATVRQIDGRGAWTVKKVAQLLDNLAQVGLLLRATDSEGKIWGYWYKCEDCLPPRGEWHKHTRGKGYLFDGSANGESMARYRPADSPQGFRVGVGSGDGNGDGADAATTQLPTRSNIVAETAAEIAEENIGAVRPDGSDHNGRKFGEAGFYKRGQYLGTSPKAVHKYIAKAWQKFGPGESAFAVYPSKFPEKWEQLCDQQSADKIVPAFELWVVEEGCRIGTTCPAGEFSKVAGNYLSKVISLKTAKPKISEDQIKRISVIAAAQRDQLWKEPEVSESAEPSSDSLFAEEK